MDLNTYLDAINVNGIDHKRVQWQSAVKPAAAHAGRTLRKVVTALVMTGANYSALAEVAGNGTETGGLPWGEWAQYPHIITHKGRDYARLYVVDGTIKTTYLVDGEVVDRDTFNGFLTPSARNSKRPVGGCVTVLLDNIKAIG